MYILLDAINLNLIVIVTATIFELSSTNLFKVIPSY